jgi:hypothetical protein
MTPEDEMTKDDPEEYACPCYAIEHFRKGMPLGEFWDVRKGVWTELAHATTFDDNSKGFERAHAYRQEFGLPLQEAKITRQNLGQ